MASRARAPAPGTFVALLAVATMATTAAAAADSGSICDTAKCGKGSCSEVPGPIPVLGGSYKCTCAPGWSQPKPSNLTLLPFTPCIIPNCSFSSACLNTTVPIWGIPLSDICAVVNCGLGGACEKGAGFNYQCRCQPGFKNLLDDTSMPCIGSTCTFGPDCAKLGLVNTPSAPAPAPVADDLY